MTIEELFGTLQMSTVATWRKHLRTAKYGKHEALDEFYKEVPEKVDALIEAWMGAHGKKVGAFQNILSSSNLNTLKYLGELKRVCKEGYSLMGENDELKSLMDDIVNQINSTLYKVKELSENKMEDKMNNMKSLVDFVNEALVNEKNQHHQTVEEYAHINDERLNPKWVMDGSEPVYEFLPNTPKIKKAAVNPIKTGKYWIAFNNIDDVYATLKKIGFDINDDDGGYEEMSWDPEYEEFVEYLKDAGANC